MRQLLSKASVCAASVLMVLPAMAQVPATDETPGNVGNDLFESASTPVRAERGIAIDEVVVTARRREEGIQTVPVAVTAISGETLSRSGVLDVNALATQSPSLVIIPSATGSRTVPTFAIRGQSQQEQSFIADPSVPVYFNEIAVQRQHGMNQALFDIQAVEVLKGPQGTLFGRNSTGGAVVIRPNRPTGDFEGYVGQSFASYGKRSVTGVLNMPLAPWAQLRIAAQSVKGDGHLYDTILRKNVDDTDVVAGRVSLALQPLDGLDTVFTFSRFRQDDGATGSLIVNLHPGSIVNSSHPASGPLGFVGDRSGEQMLADQRARGIYHTASGLEQFNRVTTWDLTNITTWALTDNLSIKNIIGTRKVDSNTLEDMDGMPVPLMHIQRIGDFRQFSEEFHLTGNTDRLEWIVGLYFFQEEGDARDYSANAKGIASAPGNLVPNPRPTAYPGWNLTWPGGRNTSKSVFTQGTYDLGNLVDGLSITAGVRYTWDERMARIRNRSGDSSDPTATPICRFSRDLDGDPNTPETPDVNVPIDQCDVRFKKEFSEPTWNLSLDYQLNRDHLIYVANRRGYRTGGFGARASTEEALGVTFDAETVTDFEVGSKSTTYIAGMPLRVNLALFHSDYDDIQRLLNIGDFTPPQTVPVNAAKAVIKGGELEFTFMPTDRIELSGFWSYTDAEYKEFIDPDTGADRSGQPFARTPENIYSITARYSLPVAAQYGDVSAEATWFHTDGYSTSDTYAPEQAIDGYSLLNLRADWRNVMGSSFDIGLFVRNALNEEYLLPYSDLWSTPTIGHITRAPGEPRLFGFDIRYRFGAAAY